MYVLCLCPLGRANENFELCARERFVPASSFTCYIIFHGFASSQHDSLDVYIIISERFSVIT